jgi:hypothetical protein
VSGQMYEAVQLRREQAVTLHFALSCPHVRVELASVKPQAPRALQYGCDMLQHP